MVRSNKDVRHEVREQMRGGLGAVTVTHVLEQPEMQDKCKLCAILTVEPGCTIGLHVHNPDAEIFYMLEGTLVMTDNGKEVELTVGDTMYTAPGESHSVENRSDKTAKIFAVVIE